MGPEDVARASEIIGRYRDLELGLVNADIKAGTDIPVVFSLGGDQGLGVIAIGFPQSGPISCTAPGGADVRRGHRRVKSPRLFEIDITPGGTGRHRRGNAQKSVMQPTASPNESACRRR
jgi:hypothetical protein